MAEDRIDSIIALAAIDKEFASVTKSITQLKAELASIGPLKTLVQDANGPKELAAATTQLSTANQKLAGATASVVQQQTKLKEVNTQLDGVIGSLNKSLDSNISKLRNTNNAISDIKEAQKQLKKQVDAGTISADAYTKKQDELSKVLFKNKQFAADLTAEIKDQTKAQFAQPKTKAEARIQNRQLTRITENTADPARLAELNSLIDRNNDLIDQNSDKLAKQKINIGNYPTAFTNAFKTLNTELENVNTKIANGASGKELDKLKQQQNGLTTAISLTNKEFTSNTSLINANKEAARVLGTTFGTNSTVFKEFNKEVGKGAKAINEVDKEVKTAAGGTGKLQKGFQGVFSVLRNIANIIPGLGLSGIVLLLLAPLEALAASFINLFSTINKGKIAVAALNEVNTKAVEIYATEKSNVENLSSVVKDNTISLGTRKEALQQLIAISPQYLSGLTLENIATAEGTKILDGFIASLQRKAELQAAIAVNAEANKTVLSLQAEKQALVDLAKQGKVSFGDLSESQQKFLDNGSLAGQFKFTADLFNVNLDKSDIKNVLDGIDDEIKKASIKVGASNKIFKDKFSSTFSADGPGGIKGIIQKLKDEIESLQKIQPTLLTEKSITENVSQVKKLQDRLDALLGKTKNKTVGTKKDGSLIQLKLEQDSEFEIYKVAQERRLRLLDAEIKDEKTYYLDKLNLLEDFNKESKNLLEAQAKEDIKNKNEERAREVKNLQESKSGKNKNQKARIDENIKIVEFNNAEAIKLIRVKLGDDILKIDEKGLESKKSILNDQLKIEQEFAKDRIDLEQETQDIVDKLKKKQIEINADYEKADFDVLQNSIEKKKEFIEQSAKGIEEILFAAIDARAQREQQALDEDLARIDARSQREIQAINGSGLAEAEKLRLITEIEKKSAFEKEQIEKKKTEIERKQRAARKIGAIAELATNTALSIFDITRKAAQAKAAAAVAYAQGNIPLGIAATASVPIILSQIPIVLGSAAINLAKLAFFKDGTKNAPKGPAVYGEDGRELVIEKSGNAYLSPSTATLTQLQGGEKIIPADITKNLLASSNPMVLINKFLGVVNKENKLDKQILSELKDISRKTGISIHNHAPIESTAYYQNAIKN